MARLLSIYYSSLSLFHFEFGEEELQHSILLNIHRRTIGRKKSNKISKKNSVCSISNRLYKVVAAVRQRLVCWLLSTHSQQQQQHFCSVFSVSCSSSAGFFFLFRSLLSRGLSNFHWHSHLKRHERRNILSCSSSRPASSSSRGFGDSLSHWATTFGRW